MIQVATSIIPAGPGLPAWLRGHPGLRGLEKPIGYLAANSRSFRFAARFLPPREAGPVADVYAYCRFTDDLADRDPSSPAERLSRLREWMDLSRRAYAGHPGGLPFLDRTMGLMARRNIPFRYAEELAAGMAMDLEGQAYPDLAALRTYTYRVAGVVGLWLTEMAGVRDPGVLARAEALGHAMQLTNILRDVGEDLAQGRVYLPADRMARHGVTVELLGRMAAGLRPTPGYAGLLEELMGLAERDYRLAFSGLPDLPAYFRRPAAISAFVYRGIHAALRRNGYDNFARRAHTRAWEKPILALRAWAELRRQRSRRRCPAAAAAALAPSPGGWAG